MYTCMLYHNQLVWIEPSISCYNSTILQEYIKIVGKLCHLLSLHVLYLEHAMIKCTSYCIAGNFGGQQILQILWFRGAFVNI